MQKPNVVYVLGGPGAGKGTQCTLLAQKPNIYHISAGDCLREERVNPDSPHGQLIEDAIRSGQIVPGQITATLLIKKMITHGFQGIFLIDGYPRNKDNLDIWIEFTAYPKLLSICREILATAQDKQPLAENCQKLILDLENEISLRDTESSSTECNFTVKPLEETHFDDENSGVNNLFCLNLSCDQDTMIKRILSRATHSGRSDDNVDSIKSRLVTFEEETKPIITFFQREEKYRMVDSDGPIERIQKDILSLFSTPF